MLGFVAGVLVAYMFILSENLAPLEVDALGLHSCVQEQMRYPKIARDEGLEGEVMVEVAVQNGAITHIQVVQSSGVQALDEAAQRSVQRARECIERKWAEARQAGSLSKAGYASTILQFPLVFKMAPTLPKEAQ